MKIRFITLLSMLLLVSLSVVGVLAQNDGDFVNDPTVNEDANACFEGGSMEGKCNEDADGDGIVTEDEIEWQWNCGWYIIRYEFGIYTFSQLPEDCQIILAEAVIPTTAPEVVEIDCEALFEAYLNEEIDELPEECEIPIVCEVVFVGSLGKASTDGVQVEEPVKCLDPCYYIGDFKLAPATIELDYPCEPFPCEKPIPTKAVSGIEVEECYIGN